MIDVTIIMYKQESQRLVNMMECNFPRTLYKPCFAVRSAVRKTADRYQF